MKNSFLNASGFIPSAYRSALPELRPFRARYLNNATGNAVAQQAPYNQANDQAATQAVLQQAQPMIQRVNLTSIPGNNVAQGQVLNIPLNNVGLNTKVTVEVSGTIAAAAAETLIRTAWSLSNFFSNIQLTDLSNYQRINTSGLHLFGLACLKAKGVYGAAYMTDSPVAMGSNFRVNFSPASVTGAINFRMFFELPLAYHEYDLRGAIYAAVTSAQWRIQLTINPNIVFPSGTADVGTGCFVSNSAAAGSQGTLSNVVISVYQHYLDQLPRNQKTGAPIVPLISLAWDYLIQSTVVPNVAAGADFPVQYANFRTFLSTIIGYDNAGTYNPGTDVNYLGIQVANQVFLQQLDPFMASLQNRQMIGEDFPSAFYVFDHRRKPIVTNQYGNTQFVMNASAASAGASLIMMYEMLSLQSQAINAGSLAAA
jgi:hypothetical protein